MNKAEGYMTIVTIVLLLSVTIFFSSVLYMDTYHEIKSVYHMTVTHTYDGQTIALGEGVIIDSYPYISWKTKYVGRVNQTFSSFNTSMVLQWAIDHSNYVFIENGFYNLTGTIVLHSYLVLDANASLFGGSANPYFYADGNNITELSLSNFWFNQP